MSEEQKAKRTMLAAMAMQGIISNTSEEDPNQIAEFAVEHADALIKELEKDED